MKKISVIIIGAGLRGMGYARIAKNMPDNYEVVGVAGSIFKRVEYTAV